MFAELEKIMAHGMENANYLEAMEANVIGKKSSAGTSKTTGYLIRLYHFNLNYLPFKAFRYFWGITDSNEKTLITLVYAIQHDDILAESLEVLKKVQPGEKVEVSLFEESIENNHPNQYSINSKHSIGQNLASSWKQAGYIKGRVKNIRTQPQIGYRVACFAFLLAYLKGYRGDFIWNSIGVKALCQLEGRVRELAIECAKRDLIQYQYAGSVTAISFTNLLTQIGIHGI